LYWRNPYQNHDGLLEYCRILRRKKFCNIEPTGGIAVAKNKTYIKRFFFLLRPAQSANSQDSQNRKLKGTKLLLEKRKMGLNSQLFILFVTYKWAQQAKVFVPGKPFHYCLM
jgi:hypothetical protein